MNRQISIKILIIKNAKDSKDSWQGILGLFENFQSKKSNSLGLITIKTCFTVYLGPTKLPTVQCQYSYWSGDEIPVGKKWLSRASKWTALSKPKFVVKTIFGMYKMKAATCRYYCFCLNARKQFGPSYRPW